MATTEAEDERDNQVSEPFIAANIDKIAPLVDNDGKIARAEEKAQKARSDLGNIYQQIENDFHGNRAAVKLARALIAGTTDKAHDFMRTFLPLARRFNLIPGEDLVDMMDRGAPPAESSEAGVSAADMAPQSATVHEFPPRENAIDRAKAAMNGSSGPPAPSGPDLDEVADATVAEIEARSAPKKATAEEIEEQRLKDAAEFEGGQANPAPAA